MIVFFISVSVIAVVFCLYVMFKPKTTEEQEYDRKLKESLKDEYIFDPETGMKITLEEAESGHWLAHDNEYRTFPEEDFDKLLTEDERIAEVATNYLKESKYYSRIELTDQQFKIIENTKILNRYDDWSYSNPFKFNGGFVILPAPELHGTTYYDEDYKESHLMFWKKIKNSNGHYYLREKSVVEKIFDKFRKDDDLTLKNYECFTFKKSLDILKINRLLENFENEKGVEIEIHNDNLFIKTLRLVNKEDIIRIEKILINIS